MYGPDGALTAKVGLADFKEWWRTSFGRHTPWGDEDSPGALVTEVETALEPEVATAIMRGGEKPAYRTLRPGQPLTEQGAPGDDVYLLLNGVLAVLVDDGGGRGGPRRPSSASGPPSRAAPAPPPC